MKQKYLKSMMLIFIISVSMFLFNMCSNKTKGTVIKTDNVEEEKDYNNRTGREGPCGHPRR